MLVPHTFSSAQCASYTASRVFLFSDRIAGIYVNDSNGNDIIADKNGIIRGVGKVSGGIRTWHGGVIVKDNAKIVGESREGIAIDTFGNTYRVEGEGVLHALSEKNYGLSSVNSYWISGGEVLICGGKSAVDVITNENTLRTSNDYEYKAKTSTQYSGSDPHTSINELKYTVDSKFILIEPYTPTPTATPGIGDIVGGEDDFDNLPPVDVPTLILPDGVVMDASAILQYDEPNANKKNTIVYNVHLINQNGEALDLPAGAILCFPYPEGLDENSGNKYRIIIHHYADNGSTEVFKSENGDIEFTKQGLCIRVSSFSPFEISWEEQPEIDLPQTGDNSHIVLWTALLTLAGTAMLTLKRKTA